MGVKQPDGHARHPDLLGPQKALEVVWSRPSTAEPPGRLRVECHPAPQLPLRLGFNSSSGKASGGGIWRGVHLGAGSAGELQTPNAISSSQGETRAPGVLCVETADSWGCRPLCFQACRHGQNHPNSELCGDRMPGPLGSPVPHATPDRADAQKSFAA